MKGGRSLLDIRGGPFRGGQSGKFYLLARAVTSGSAKLHIISVWLKSRGDRRVLA